MTTTTHDHDCQCEAMVQMRTDSEVSGAGDRARPTRRRYGSVAAARALARRELTPAEVGAVRAADPLLEGVAAFGAPRPASG